MWKEPPKHLLSPLSQPSPELVSPAEKKSLWLKRAITALILTAVLAVTLQSFLHSRKLLAFFKSEVPTVTQVWSTFGKGFQRAQTHLVTADFLGALYLVEKEFDVRGKMAQGDLTYQALFASAQVPSLFQKGPLEFLERPEFCSYNSRIFAGQPNPCQRLRPLHRSLHQMSAYLTLGTEQILKAAAGDKMVDLARKQTVAALLYFCDAKEAGLYVYRGFKAPGDLVCSEMPIATVIRRIKTYQDAFGRAQLLTSL